MINRIVKNKSSPNVKHNYELEPIRIASSNGEEIVSFRRKLQPIESSLLKQVE